jgi:hypothetical protein
VIVCPNCQTQNIDGTLFCDNCIWDLSTVEAVPGDVPAESGGVPPAAATDGSSVNLGGDVPMADVPMADVPMAAPPSAGLRPPTGARPPTASQPPVSGIRPPTAAQPPVSAVRPPTAAQPPVSGVRPPTAAQPPVSAVRPPTAAQPPVSGIRPPTAAQPPVSAVRPPTAAKPVSAVRPPTAAQPQLVAPGETVIRVFPAAMAKFLVVRGLNTSVEYPIYEGPNFIGRFDENPVDIDLTPQEAEDNPWASRQHACVSYENGGLFIEDLGSVNGTFVNKNKITKGEKVALKNGDYVQTGTVMFKVKY